MFLLEDPYFSSSFLPEPPTFFIKTILPFQLVFHSLYLFSITLSFIHFFLISFTSFLILSSNWLSLLFHLLAGSSGCFFKTLEFFFNFWMSLFFLLLQLYFLSRAFFFHFYLFKVIGLDIAGVFFFFLNNLFSLDFAGAFLFF